MVPKLNQVEEIVGCFFQLDFLLTKLFYKAVVAEVNMKIFVW